MGHQYCWSSLWLSMLTITVLFHYQNGVVSQQQQQQQHDVSTPPPLPVPPIPTFSQLKWQQREMVMFLHFGVNTFNDVEWGNGTENPAIFDPTGLNAAQWVETAANAGFSLMILTAKHHDGFCLWPSKYTDHSVIGSPWKNGHGDIMRELVDAATDHGGIDVGFYLSPWDRHDKRYGDYVQYNEYYLGQLQELLNNYGNIREVWFDGAKGSPAPNMTYDLGSWYSVVKSLQSWTNIFSDAGPDLRWVGNEDGFANTTSWSPINRTSLIFGETSNDRGYLWTGDPDGTDWLPPECDVSIREGWFWHESQAPKNLTQLLDIYYTSVGRNCVLLLNVPPNKTGLISQTDVQVLREFRIALDTIFSTNLAYKCYITVSTQRGGPNSAFGPENLLDDDLWTYWGPENDVGNDKAHWVELRGPSEGLDFNVVRIQEAIGLGQRIKLHEIYVDGKLLEINGTTVGYKRLHRLEQGVVHGTVVRIVIKEYKGLPLVSSLGLHFDPYWKQVQSI